MASSGSPASSSRTLLAAMSAGAMVIALQVAGKATRDAYFLSTYPASRLPMVIAGTAVLSVMAAFLTSGILTRYGPRRAIPLAFLINATLFGVDWWLSQRSPAVTAVVVYLHLGVLGPILISGFWSLVNERFDPHAAKQNISRIAGSAAFGGVAGALVAERVAGHFSLPAMLPVLGVVSIAGGLMTHRLAPGGGTASASTPESERVKLSTLARAPYLRQLAALVLLTSLTSGLLDFVLKYEVSKASSSATEMTSFFALFHGAVAVSVFLVQSTVTSSALRKMGVGGTIALLPGALALGGVLAAAVVGVWTATLVKGIDATLQSSVFRAGYELLYTPVRPAFKRASKTVIDVGFDRLGDVAAAGAVSAALLLFPLGSTRALTLLAVLAAGVGLMLAMGLHRGYVRELSESLRSGVLSARDVLADDATTHRTLTDTTLAMDREQLLREIAELQRRNPEAAPDLPDTLESSVSELSPAKERLLARARELLSGRPAVVRDLLAHRDLEPELIPFIIPLLRLDELGRPAIRALQRVGEANVGQLIDALLGDAFEVGARRRIPRVLESFRSPRVREGLLASLDDPHFEIRFQGGRSLLRMVTASPELAPDRDAIFGAVLRETAVSPQSWGADSPRGAASDRAQREPNGDSARRASATPPRLAHVVTLLGTVLEREPLELCLKAFTAGGEALQGTALEYLENVLPPNVYSGLQGHLTSVQVQRTERRTRERIVRDLHESVGSLSIDRAALAVQGSRTEGSGEG